MSFSFVPLGVGDAFTADHFSTCLLLEADGRRLLVDCPHPIRRMLRDGTKTLESPVDAGDVDGVVITHLHADHASGLEGLAYFWRFVLKRRLPVLAHPKVLARLWDGHLAAGMEHLLRHADGEPEEMRFTDYCEAVPLDDAAATTFGAFTLECRRTIHHIPTYALRIAAGGRTLGLSADTAFDPALIAWLAEADLVVHETNLGVHTPYEKLAALDPALRERMRLIHYTDAFDVEGSVIEALREGRRYAV